MEKDEKRTFAADSYLEWHEWLSQNESSVVDNDDCIGCE